MRLLKIRQMKNQALKDIKNTSVKISLESVKMLLKNSIDKNKLDKIYLDQRNKKCSLRILPQLKFLQMSPAILGLLDSTSSSLTP